MEGLEKQLAELKAALEASTEAKAKAEIAAQVKAVQDAIAAEVKKATDAAAEAKTELETVKKEATELKAKVTELEKKGGRLPGGNGKEDNPFVKEVSEKKEEIKGVINRNGKEVEIKADTLRASIATNVHQFELPGIGQLARIQRSLYDLFPKISIPAGNNAGKVAYVDWDESTISKAAAAVAEGSAFPESTAKFKGYTLSLVKIGDSLPVSEEFLEDEVMAAQELSLFIGANVDSKVDDQVVNGDNTGNNAKGLLTSIDAYTPVASAIADANIYDLIVKVKSSITSTGGSKYQPNFAAMNETTLNTLVLKKDANYNYIFPPNHPIYNMIVVVNNIADDVMVVGDSRFGRIYEKPGILLSVGEVGTDFTDDMKTLKARKRFNLLIRAADKGGFAKVTSVSTALTTLAS